MYFCSAQCASSVVGRQRHLDELAVKGLLQQSSGGAMRKQTNPSLDVAKGTDDTGTAGNESNTLEEVQRDKPVVDLIAAHFSKVPAPCIC